VEVPMRRAAAVIAAFVLAGAFAAGGAAVRGASAAASVLARAEGAERIRAGLVLKASESRVEEEKCSRELDLAIARFDQLSRGLSRVEREFDQVADIASVPNAEAELEAEMTRMKARINEMKSSLKAMDDETVRLERALSRSSGDERGQAAAVLAHARRKADALRAQVAGAEADAAQTLRVLGSR
jgi:chromosome segregation ATPase